MQVVLLEDLKNSRFGPLTLLRPEFDLRCGALELREKLEKRRPDWNVTLCPRVGLVGDAVKLSIVRSGAAATWTDTDLISVSVAPSSSRTRS